MMKHGVYLYGLNLFLIQVTGILQAIYQYQVLLMDSLLIQAQQGKLDLDLEIVLLQ